MTDFTMALMAFCEDCGEWEDMGYEFPPRYHPAYHQFMDGPPVEQEGEKPKCPKCGSDNLGYERWAQ